MRADAGESLTGAHGGIGLHYHYPVVVERNVDGSQLLADARGVGRCGVDEEGAVGTQTLGYVTHLPVCQVEREELVQSLYRECAVCRPSSHTGLYGYVFGDRDVDTRQSVSSCHFVIRLHYYVVFRPSVDYYTVCLQRASRRFSVFFNSQYICYWHGAEHGFQVVVAVASFSCDVQSQVYLGTWKECYLIHIYPQCCIVRCCRLQKSRG